MDGKGGMGLLWIIPPFPIRLAPVRKKRETVGNSPGISQSHVKRGCGCDFMGSNGISIIQWEFTVKMIETIGKW